MKTPFVLLVAVSSLFTLSLTADEPSVAEMQTVAEEATNQEVAQNNTMMQNNNCESLSDDQQMFAAKLNSTNKMMFCSKFSSSQRMSAMQMAGTTGANGRTMTPDQAVEQVSRNSNTRSGGACPVR